jgi:hypothetical protein
MEALLVRSYPIAVRIATQPLRRGRLLPSDTPFSKSPSSPSLGPLVSAPAALDAGAHPRARPAALSSIKVAASRPVRRRRPHVHFAGRRLRRTSRRCTPAVRVQRRGRAAIRTAAASCQEATSSRELRRRRRAHLASEAVTQRRNASGAPRDSVGENGSWPDDPLPGPAPAGDGAAAACVAAAKIAARLQVALEGRTVAGRGRRSFDDLRHPRWQHVA